MRVCFLSIVGCLLIVGTSGPGMAAEPAGLEVLPDGSRFVTWEVAPSHSRTYYVNPAHPQAADDGPGSEAAPFRTIGRAAEVLRPGERVVVTAGVYRERVCPARGGTGPDKMITYEAAPGAEVILKGSRVLDGPWTAAAGQAGVWNVPLDKGLFAEENPFALVNLTDHQIDRCMSWAVPVKGNPTFAIRRGLVFQDGRRLRQVARRESLSEPGTYCVTADGQALAVRPFGDVDPRQASFEVTVSGTIFAPKEFGLGYIRVRGLTIEQCGNCFPRPQQGALSTMRGHHWIIEENTVRQCNAIGIDVGDQFDTQGPELAQGGRHIVRRNTVTDCGIGGIEGKRIEATLIEENTLRRCGWHRIWRIYEVAGIKVHCTHSCLVRRNLVTDTIAAPGIWLDYTNVNSRVTQNVILRADCSNGGIFMEASQQPNLVDRNFVWGTRGAGIYQHDCDELTIAGNLVAGSDGAGVEMRICKGRKVGGRLSTAKRNTITGNLLIGNGSPLSISDPDNQCDYNAIAPGKAPFDLAAWHKKTGWDEHSVTARIDLQFDPETLTLTWSCDRDLPPLPRPALLARDFWGRPYQGELIPPGPFGPAPRAATVIGIDPRRVGGEPRGSSPR